VHDAINGGPFADCRKVEARLLFIRNGSGCERFGEYRQRAEGNSPTPAFFRNPLRFIDKSVYAFIVISSFSSSV
jgi:hypothetical protein